MSGRIKEITDNFNNSNNVDNNKRSCNVAVELVKKLI